MSCPKLRLTTVKLLLATIAFLAIPTTVFAQTRSLEEGPIIRRQLLFRSDRVEIEPGLAHSLNDPYRRTLFLNAGFNYHLTNAFSLGLTVGWGALNYNSNILDNIEASADPQVSRSLGFAEKTLLGNFHLAYVPFFGKWNFLEVGTVNWDFHVLAGVGAALLSSETPDLEGFRFGPAFGAGLRFFFDGDMALSVNVVDHMFSSADVQRGGVRAEEEFSHTVLFSLGVSFFVTGDLRVSR